MRGWRGEQTVHGDIARVGFPLPVHRPVACREINVLFDLDAFLQEHKRCGLFDSEVTRGEIAYRVTFACECGAVISRTVATAPYSRS